MKTIEIQVSRESAIRYIAWEYGLDKVQSFLKQMVPDKQGQYDIASLPIWSYERDKALRSRSANKMRKWAHGLAKRVETANAYQQGRMGKPLSDPCIKVLVNV